MANSFDCFSVQFAKVEVFVSGQVFSLGQCAIDILNPGDTELTEIDQRIGQLMPAVKNLFCEKS